MSPTGSEDGAAHATTFCPRRQRRRLWLSQTPKLLINWGCLSSFDSLVRHFSVVLTTAFVVVKSSQNCITLQGSHYSQATVGLNIAVNPVQLLSARMSVQTITEHHPRCEGRRIISKAGGGGLQPLSRSLHASGAPDFVIRFVETTFSILETGAIHEIAAVFTFSREDLVPPMFLRVTEECTMHRQSYPHFFYYLDRHIEVDSGSHGPLAHTLVAELCGGGPARLREAEAAACRALEARLALWDVILPSL